MAKIAIYEPDPRICGPDTWAQNLRLGFRELGHQCDVITFTRAGRRAPAWGRVEQAKSSSLSCALVPDVCAKQDDAGRVLDQYDLVVLTDVKTATCDNAALKDEMLDEPVYITTLKSTDTPWTSALHGRWYYAHPDPIPAGLSEKSGAPFIHDLLKLPNFSGFLIAHAKDFDKYCPALQAIRKEYLPLPYQLSHTDEQATTVRSSLVTLAVIGRMIPTKHRHVVNEMLTRGMLRDATCYYGGGCVCTHGPSETYVMNEQLAEAGWETSWGDDGVRKTKPFTARHASTANHVHYLGAYVDPYEVLHRSKCHVGITDCDFSGGLFEFATLEAIDCGCLPIVTEPFYPHVGTDVECLRIPHAIKKFSPKVAREALDELYERIADCVITANSSWSPEAVRHNRECVARENDPRRHARTFLENCL